MQHYIYQQGNELVRQSSQAQIMHVESLHLLKEVGLDSGSALVDFGCGTADLTFEVAQHVGPVGKVLGIDSNVGLVAYNQQKKSQTHLDNIHFRIGMAEQYSDMFLYDIAFARFLLAHTRHPLPMVKNMLNLTKNYGHVVIEDVDIATMSASPFCPELEVLKTLISALVRYFGGDATIGPELGALMYTAGLQRIKILEHQPCGRSGPIKEVPLRVLESLAPVLLRVGLLTPSQFTRLATGLKELAEDDSVMLYFPKIYQVIGSNSRYLKLGAIRPSLVNPDAICSNPGS